MICPRAGTDVMTPSKVSKPAVRTSTGIAAAALAASVIGVNATGARAGGEVWTLARSANVALAGGTIQSVSCSSTDACTWSLRSTPNPSPAQDLLSGVSCGASQVCTAVGQAQDAGGVASTLIETGG